MYENQITFLIKPNVNIFSTWGFSRQKQWNKVANSLYNETSVVYEMIDYLKVKLEESKLMATYENGVRYPSAQEKIYEDILERLESGNYER